MPQSFKFGNSLEFGLGESGVLGLGSWVLGFGLWLWALGFGFGGMLAIPAVPSGVTFVQ